MTRGKASPRTPVPARARGVADRDDRGDDREPIERDEERRQRHAPSITGRRGARAAILGPRLGTVVSEVVMRKSLALIFAALLASILAGCGNKGELVRPNPSTLPPPAPTPATAPDAPAKPAQDSNGQ